MSSISTSFSVCSPAAQTTDASMPLLPQDLVTITPLSDGSVEVEVGANLVTLTISATARFDGVYTFDPEDLAVGPLNLVPAEITGTPAVGQTLAAEDGLWVYDGATAAPTITRAWRRGGAAVPGETGISYDVQAADQGSDLTVEETASTGNGSRSVISPSVSIPAAPAGFAAPTDLGSKLMAWLDFTDGSTLWQDVDGTLAAELGDPVARVDDKSGNGNTFTASSSLSPGTGARVATGVAVQNAGFRIAAPATALTTDMELYAVIEADGDTTFCLLGKNLAQSHILGTAQENSPIGTAAGFDGSIVFSSGGVTLTNPDRNDLFSAWGSGVAVAGARGVDLATDTSLAGDLLMMAYNSTAIRFDGQIRHFVLTTALTDPERVDITEWLEERSL